MGARSLLGELRSVAQVLRSESTPPSTGPVVVSGMLADQLAKELGAGADSGAVRVGDASVGGVEVLVRIVAGDPSADDEAVVREADRRGVGVVLVQLWPQAEWTRPYVLTPFVVECRAGEGFPVREIADRIVEASAEDAGLAVRVPALRPSVEKSIVLRTAIRAALLGALPGGGVRRVITLEQIRMVTRLASIQGPAPQDARAAMASVGGTAALVVVSGVAFRGLARATREILPTPIANSAVALAGSWAIAKTARATRGLRRS